MKRRTRTDDWGFPRWRPYGQEREAATVRLCDRQGCGKAGDCPAPKSAWTEDKWWFCQEHAADYNRGWDYFAGLGDQAAREQAESEARAARGFQRAGHWAWGEAAPDGLTRAERDAYAALDLEPGADDKALKAAYRRLAKQYHPDAAGDSPEAAARFHAIRAAYDILMRRPRQPA